MNKEMFKAMMNGLVSSAIEKICVLGPVDAKDDVQKIIEMVADLESFWDYDEDEGIDWHDEIVKAVDRCMERKKKWPKAIMERQ